MHPKSDGGRGGVQCSSGGGGHHTRNWPREEREERGHYIARFGGPLVVGEKVPLPPPPLRS